MHNNPSGDPRRRKRMCKTNKAFVYTANHSAFP